MGTFVTAVTWGLGVSLGAAVGCLLFIVLWRLLDKVLTSPAAKAIEEVNALNLAALNRRNELTEEQVGMLAKIVATIEFAVQARGVALGELTPSDRPTVMDELTKQAQELDMGYERRS